MNNSFYSSLLFQIKTKNLINLSIPILEKESIIKALENKFPNWEKFIPDHLRNENYQPNYTLKNSLVFFGLPNKDPHLFLNSLEYSSKNAGLCKE